MTETQAVPDALRGLDEQIQTMMDDWNVPGLALSVVQDGEVRYARGFGYRDLEQRLPVTPDTLFAIGSTTKAFTTTALAMLVEEGTLDWDKPVHTYLPEFRMHDAFANERITPRDLTCHRSGLPRHDLAWYGSNATRQELIGRIAHLEPTRDFRTTWQYQNLMFLTAGYLAGRVAGQEWEELVRDRILVPLGMDRTNFSVAVSQSDDNFSYPYEHRDGETSRMPFRAIDAIGPAGSINSSVNEMARWIQFHLNHGEAGARRLVGEAHLAETYKPHMPMERVQGFEEISFSAYGLGWGMDIYRGHRVIQHSGGIDGFTAMVALLPEVNSGVVILTNRSQFLPYALLNTVADRLFALDPIDWNCRFQEFWTRSLEQMKAGTNAGLAERIEGTHPSHPLDAYAGPYEHPGYGRIQISVRGDVLHLLYNSFDHDLDHHHYDVFAVRHGEFQIPVPVSFTTGVDGAITTLSAKLEPTADPIVFTRVSATADTALLERLAGEYGLLGRTASVRLANGALRLTLPEQPEYVLTPSDGTRFTAASLPGFSVEFTEEDGQITGAIFTQPNGTAQATRR